jgi:hypothetical protein
MIKRRQLSRFPAARTRFSAQGHAFRNIWPDPAMFLALCGETLIKRIGGQR